MYNESIFERCIDDLDEIISRFDLDNLSDKDREIIYDRVHHRLALFILEFVCP